MNYWTSFAPILNETLMKKISLYISKGSNFCIICMNVLYFGIYHLEEYYAQSVKRSDA